MQLSTEELKYLLAIFDGVWGLDRAGRRLVCRILLELRARGETASTLQKHWHRFYY